MGSSISKYEDLELSTAEGGLEPLPTSKKSKQFCRNCNNLVDIFCHKIFGEKTGFWPKKYLGKSHRKDDQQNTPD